MVQRDEEREYFNYQKGYLRQFVNEVKPNFVKGHFIHLWVNYHFSTKLNWQLPHM